MKQLNRLVLKEVFGPWLFGVGLFTSLLMAGTYLGRIAGYVVDGVPPKIIAEVTMLLMPQILVKTFSMSVLLATLLAFGRLSSDSEIVALKASGASVFRMVWPVIVFSIVIACVTFVFNERVVPEATARSNEVINDIARSSNVRTGQPTAFTQVENGKLRAVIAAKDIDVSSRRLKGVTILGYDDNGQERYIGFAKELEFRGVDDWHVLGGMDVIDLRGNAQYHFDEAWPQQLPGIKKSFQDVINPRTNDYDRYTMAELLARIRDAKRDGSMTPSQIADSEYGYWNKISVPLAAVIFGALGAVLGIRNARTGTATGFALAIAIIFGYVTLANFMNVWALGGLMPAWVASFAPILIGAVTSGVIMWRRNG